ncbi:MAG: type II CAAX prenyl endopeptidase Rce1 family protein, partial [Candidatus Odinarchaeota archaeon]
WLPLSVLPLLVFALKIESEILILHIALAIVSGLLVFAVFYFFAIPRLKLHDIDYKEPHINGFIIVLLVFGVAMFLRQVITGLFVIAGVNIQYNNSWYIVSYYDLTSPMITVLFLLRRIIIMPLYTEVVFRRTVIPSLEDRGMSPFHAVLVSSLAFSLLDLILYLNSPDPFNNFYWICSTFMYGFFTGIIYILTRNLIFPVFYACIYHVYRLSGELGAVFGNEFMLAARALMNITTFAVGLGILIYVIWKFLEKQPSFYWISILRKHSVPNIKRGVAGYFIISLGLLVLQLLVHVASSSFTGETFPGHFLIILAFYLLAFSIPFWMTITTEYARD